MLQQLAREDGRNCDVFHLELPNGTCGAPQTDDRHPTAHAVLVRQGDAVDEAEAQVVDEHLAVQADVVGHPLFRLRRPDELRPGTTQAHLAAFVEHHDADQLAIHVDPRLAARNPERGLLVERHRAVGVARGVGRVELEPARAVVSRIAMGQVDPPLTGARHRELPLGAEHLPRDHHPFTFTELGQSVQDHLLHFKIDRSHRTHRQDCSSSMLTLNLQFMGQRLVFGAGLHPNAASACAQS